MSIDSDFIADQSFVPATNYDPATAGQGDYYFQSPQGGYEEFIPGVTPLPSGTQLFTTGGAPPAPVSGWTAPATPTTPAAPAAPVTPTTPPASATPPASSALDQATATQIIDTVLAPWGINVNATAQMPDGNTETLSAYLFNLITSQGLTDPTTIADMIESVVPQTPQFQAAFPGYAQAVANGVIKTPTDYVSAAESAEAIMTNYGVPQSLITPTNIGNLIAGGVSANELTDRLENGYNAVENAPAEVQNYFDEEFGVNSQTALATLFLTPADQSDGQTWETLSKMLAGAQVGGAALASNINLGQGLAQRLADMGVTYSTAQQNFAKLTSQAGLYQQTVGEANKAPVPGTANANQPLTEGTTGVEAQFGLSAKAEQQVENEALARQNAFKGAGGATSTEAEGYQGIGHAEAF